MELLDSEEKIDKFDEKLHPWAPDPATIGELSAMQVAVLASSAEDDDDIKDKFRKLGVFPKLKAYIESNNHDRVQVATVTLSALTADNPGNGHATYDEIGLKPILRVGQASQNSALRSTIALLLRDVSTVNMNARLNLLSLGGAQFFVKQLDFPPDLGVSKNDALLEGLLNIQDLIEDSNGNVLERAAREFVVAGCKAELRKIKPTIQDEETLECLEELDETLNGT